MFKVPKLVNFFESLSGSPTHRDQKHIRLPDKYGTKTDNRSYIANTANIKGVSEKTQNETEAKMKYTFPAVIGTIGQWFRCDINSSHNLVSNLIDKTDVQELEHHSKENIDSKENICMGKNEKKTLRTDNGLQRDDAKAIVSEGTSKRQGQFLGSNKNIAFLVGDDTSTSKNCGNYHTKVCDQDNSKEKHIPTDHLQDAGSVPCLPRFSLLEGKSLKETSGNLQNSFTSTTSELDHDLKQTAMTNSLPKSTTTSRTSGIYSGSEYTQNNGESKGSKTEQKRDHRIERFVEQTWTRQKEMPRIKYPSEPSNIQDLPLRTRANTQENVVNIKHSNVSRANTQENVVNIKHSNVSILSSESETRRASQLSVISSEQETRDWLAEHTRELLTVHAKGPKVPEQKRLKRAKKILEDENVVVIVGKGSGSTHLGMDLLLSDNSEEKFNLIEVNELAVCLHSKKSVCIFIDDIFGTNTTDEKAIDVCLKYMKICKRKKNGSKKNNKLILTVKDNVYKHCKERLDDYNRSIVNLEGSHLQLEPDEMVEIMRNMIENNRDEFKVLFDRDSQTMLRRSRNGWVHISESFLVKVAENALPSGFPKKFKSFLETRNNTRKGLDFFIRPSDDFLGEITQLKHSCNQSDLEKNLTLVMTSVLRGKLTMEKVGNINLDQKVGNINLDQTMITKTMKKKQKRKKKVKAEDDQVQTLELPWWIEIIRYYSLRSKTSLIESVKNGLYSLKGSYLRENMKGVFSFAAPCVKNAILFSIGKDFPHFILKLCDQSFFQDFVGSDTSLENDEDNCVKLNVQNEAICSQANELLLELCSSGKAEMFAKHRLMRDPRFLQQFFESFRKDFGQIWEISKMTDLSTFRCAISCALDVGQPSANFTVRSNFAYSLLQHKIWGQKRKTDKYWSAQVEKEVILHCCKFGSIDTYFDLRKKYNIPVDYECLKASVECGSCAIVEDVLDSIGKRISDAEKCTCMEIALMKYSRNPLMSRHDVVNALLKFVSVDYKITGIDPIIHKATKTGDARVIVTLEVFDGDINVTNLEGKSCLHEAIQRNKAAFLHMALQHGADQWKSDKLGVLPIHEGARQNKPYIMRLLIDADHDVAAAKDRTGRQPLHYAAIYNSVKAANLLLEQSVEVDAYDNDRNTPLHYAAASGKATVMHSLLEAHADVKKTDKNGNSPLLIACKAGNVKGVKRLIGGQTVDDATENECLFVAVEENKPDILALLVDKGLNINQTNKDGKTLLCFAIEMNADLAEYLVKEKADVNMPCQGRFPLHYAASNGKKEVFQTLVDAGANMAEVTVDNNDTVLHTATANGQDELVYYILQKADYLTSCRNRQGEVPLHIAAREGNLHVARAILASGSERSPINREFKTPLCLVEEKLEGLRERRETNHYDDYYSVMMLLKGHRRVRLETSL